MIKHDKMSGSYTFSHLDGGEDLEIVFNFNATSIDEVVENIRLFLLGVGFHPDNVKEYLGES